MKHGASAYRNGGCRCDACRDANAAEQNRQNANRRAARVLVDGRLVARLPADRHGLWSTYVNHGCQCHPCRMAGSVRNAQYKARLREAS